MSGEPRPVLATVLFAPKWLALTSEQLLTSKQRHVAVGVVDHHDLLGREELERDRHRQDRIFGKPPTRVPHNVRITRSQSEKPLRLDWGVHTRQDHHAAARANR